MNKIYIVGAGPGDPDLLTVKGMRLLQEADVIIHAGSLVNPVVLKFARPEAVLYDSSGMVLEEIVQVMLDSVRGGRKVVRLTSGDPCIFGAVGEMTEPVIKAGLAYEIVPGVSSFLAGAAALKRELTVPEVAQTVILTRCEGRTPMPELEQLKELGRHRATLIIFLSVHLAGKVQVDLLSAYPPETPIAIVYRASWDDETIIRGNLKNLQNLVRENKITRTTLIYIGNFLEAEGTRSKLYDASFTHGYRKASK
ncbi:MAG: precorrin-4 C(11)-methyltransferase [Nitrospiria bacterium]